jgi:hypothetical protein
MNDKKSKGASRRPVPQTIDLAADEVREVAAADAVGDGSAHIPGAAMADAGGTENSAFAENGEKRANEASEAHASRGAAPRRGWRPMATGALALALFGGGVWWWTGDRWPLVRGPAVDAEVAARDAETLAAIDTLAGRLAETERMLSELAAGGAGKDGEAASRLPDKVAAIEARLALAEANRGVAGEPATGDGKIAALEQRLAVAESALAAAAGVPADLDRRLAALDAALASMAARLAALEKADAAARAASSGLDEKTAAARAAIATALRSAFERGEPFAQLLASAKELAGSDPALAALAEVAAGGAPTVASLKREFAALSPAIDMALAPRPQGIVDRLLANARALVRARPEGPIAGDEPVAVLSRIEAALGGDDVAGALAEWEKLPEAARQATAGWRDKAATRVEAAISMSRALALLQ